MRENKNKFKMVWNQFPQSIKQSVGNTVESESQPPSIAQIKENFFGKNVSLYKFIMKSLLFPFL